MPNDNEFENPIAVNLSEEEEKNIISEMEEFLEESDDFRKPYEDKWFDYYVLLKNYMEELEEEDQWMSNIHIPISATLIYTVVPMLASQFIDPIRTFARVLPANSDSDEDIYKARITEKIVTCQFRKMKYGRSQVTSLTEAATYGTSWQKVSWKTETKSLKRPRRIQVPLLGNIQELIVGYEREPITIFDGPCVEPIDLFYFYPDKKSTNIDDMKRYIHKTYLYPSDFKKMMDNGTFKKIDMEDIGDYSEYDEFKGKREASVEKSDSTSPYGTKSERVEVIEYYTNGDFFFIANRKFIVRMEREPFWRGGHNIILYQFVPNPFEIYGVGLCELTEPISEDMDFLHNSRNDWITMAIKRPLLADKSRLVDPDQLRRIQPFDIIDVQSVDDVRKIAQPWPIGDVFPSFYKEQDINHNLVQMVSGINDYIRGQNAPSMNDTATGISIITRQAMNRMTFHMQYISYVGVVPTIEKVIDLDNMFLKQEQRFNITDEEGFMAGPNDIISEYDVIPKIDPNQSIREIERQQFTNSLQMVGGSPQMGQFVKWDKMLIRLYKMFDSIENPKEFLFTPEEVMANQQQQQAMMMAQQQQQQMIPQGGGQRPPQPKQPPYGNDIDMTKMMSRGFAGNRDKVFENRAV